MKEKEKSPKDSRSFGLSNGEVGGWSCHEIMGKSRVDAGLEGKIGGLLQTGCVSDVC